MMGYHDLSAAGGGLRVSTQDRAIREGGEGEHASEHEGGDAAAGADVAGSQTTRMRAMQRRWIQRKASRAGGGGAAAAASIPGGAGAQLGGETKSRMEHTIGADLSGVRVHTGGDSADAADDLGARAFTVGSDVHFNRGEFAPGSKEGDRLLAHELTHVVQGQKSGVQRKADPAHGDAEGGGEAGGHEVSEPGDPAEHEADAMGDHAADELHGGGGDKGGGEHGGGDKAGGKKVEREEKPPVGAAAPSVGRKIFRAKKPAAPDKAAKGGKQPAKDAPPANGLSPKDQEKVKTIQKALDTSKIDTLLVSTLKLYQSEIDRLSGGAQGQDASVKQLKASFDSKWTAVFQAFDTSLAQSTASLTAIKTDDPNGYTAFQAAVKGADPWALTGMQKEFRDRPAFTKFVSTKQSTEKTIREHGDHVFTKATSDLKATPAEAADGKPQDDPMAKTDAIFESARPWFNKIPGTIIFQEALQNAFLSKRDQINAAHAKKREEQQKEKEKKTAGPAPGGGKDATAAGGKPGAHDGDHGAGASSASTHGAKPATEKPPTLAPAAHAPHPAATPAPAAHDAAPAGGHDAHGAPAGDQHHGDAKPASAASDHGHAADAHGKDAGKDHGKDDKHGGHGDHQGDEKKGEVEALTAEQQDLVAVINGLGAGFATQATKTDALVSTALGAISAFGAWVMHVDPVVGGAIGMTTLGINLFIKGPKKERLERAKALAELVPLLKDPAKIAEVLQMYRDGMTDLQMLNTTITAKIEEQAPKAETAKHGAAGVEEAEEGFQVKEEGEDKKDKKKGKGHGGLMHRLHQGETAAHVAHTGAEFGTKVFEFLHHAHEVLPGVGLGVAGLKDFLAYKEVQAYKDALEKKKNVDEKLAALSGGAAPPQATQTPATPPK
jgi:hypothetical protein